MFLELDSDGSGELTLEELKLAPELVMQQLKEVAGTEELRFRIPCTGSHLFSFVFTHIMVIHTCIYDLIICISSIDSVTYYVYLLF